MKAVIYSRISDSDQSDYSLEAQIEECQKYIEKERYELVNVYLEDGYSAKDTNRPQLKQMLADLKQRKFNMIVIWRLDRLTRDTIDGLLMVKNDFKPYGAEFASVTEDIDTSTPDGMMMFTIRLSMAQNEREKIAERASLGQAARARKGLRNSPAKRYGYDNTPNLSYTINEQEAPVVRQIFQWYLSGLGKNKIATLLNTVGIDGEPIPSPKKNTLWREGNVSNILTSWTYIGAVHWKRRTDPEDKRIIVRGMHEPIISEETFMEVQRVLKRKRENSMSTSSYDFPFSSILKCGECFQVYRGQQKLNQKKIVSRYYRCRGTEKQKVCGASNLSEPKMSKLFLSFLREFTFETVEPNKPLGTRDAEKEVKRLTKLIEDGTTKKKNYTRAMGSGKLDYSLFEELMEEENKKTEEWQKELSHYQEVVPNSNRSRRDIIQVINHMTENWDTMTLMERKILVQQVFEAIVIKKNDGVWSIVGYKIAE